MELWVIGGLILLLIFQQIFYLRQIQTLIDKLMSRSYTEYTKATSEPILRAAPPQEAPEDLRVLQGFTI